MSSTIWTPSVVSSEAFELHYNAWRMVDAQHLVSTMKLVDSLAEQEALEEILDRGKPPIVYEAARLHSLLSTPFRYETHPPHGSRFRAVHDPGVFYGAESIKTAAAETGFRRWQFLQDSTGLERLPSAQFTAFSIAVSGKMVDLRSDPFMRNNAEWTHSNNYQATQAFARVAREASLAAILYRSVRDPEQLSCIAVLTPTAFATKNPDKSMQTWSLSILPKEAVWKRDGFQSFAIKTSFWDQQRTEQSSTPKSHKQTHLITPEFGM